MLYCNFLTSDYKQKYTNILLENGEFFDMYIWYAETQYSWFMNITYGLKVINGIKVITSLNLLNQYKNILPFGISCYTDDMSDPYFINDFENGRAMLYLLNSDEIK